MEKKIYACRNTAEAGMLISLLKENGFNPLELQTASHISIAGANIYYYVQIPKEEYEEAKKFLIKEGFKDII